MPKKPDSLDELREAIDRIDDELLDLLVERAETVRRIAGEKARVGAAAPAAMVPNREAQILRRLVARAGGRLAPEIIVRLWRELFPAMVRLQGALEVAVDGSSDTVALWDLARAHFGSATPMINCDSAHHAMAAVADAAGRGAIGVAVVPLPGGEGDPMWWRRLDSDGETTLKIVARLPFVEDAPGLPAGLEALAVSTAAPGPSGDDKTVLIVATEPEVSRGAMGDLLEGAGLRGRALGIAPADGGAETFLHLLEVEGFVGEDDERLDRLLEAAAGVISRIVQAGGYAVPLAAT